MIFNAGEFPANRLTTGMTSKTSVDLSFEDGEVVILGTEYAGEMKKGVFTIMNYLMPEARRAVDALLGDGRPNDGPVVAALRPIGHGQDDAFRRPASAVSSATTSIAGATTASSTSKAAATPRRSTYAESPSPRSSRRCASARCWRTSCYDDATTTWITPTRASRRTRAARIRSSSSPTRKSRAWPAIPTDVIFLTCDAFGVLPPVSRLTPAQAMYHFISGYTAKVAGTEMGVTEPQATFSPCFGGPFLVWHPTKYAELLAEEMRTHKASVWLVNTGWGGGPYGVGSRMKLALHASHYRRDSFRRTPQSANSDGSDIRTARDHAMPERTQ